MRERISDHFRPQSIEMWRKLIEKELKGQSYDDYLVWESLDGFVIEAWQTTLPEQIPELLPLQEPWKITEIISEKDALKANEKAISALSSGAEAIWFAKSFRGAALEVASKGIDQNIAPVFACESTQIDPFKSLLKTGIEEIGTSDRYLIDGRRMRSCGASIVEELAFMIAQSIEIGEKYGFNSVVIFHSGYGSAYLSEIAKTRALRWIWSRVLEHEGISPANPQIFATNIETYYSVNDEYTNVLRLTTSAMSAAIGGATYIGLMPWNQNWDQATGFSERITRNVQLLLKEEARIDKNLNQSDGAYFIEHLTASIAKNAWALVQQILAEGGFTNYAKSGKLKSLLEHSTAKYFESIIKGKTTILNVNKYPANEQLTENVRLTGRYTLLPGFVNYPSMI